MDPTVAQKVPEQLARRFRVLPLRITDSFLEVATANPFDQAARKQVEAMVDYHVFWYVAHPGDIVMSLRLSLGLDIPKAARA